MSIKQPLIIVSRIEKLVSSTSHWSFRPYIKNLPNATSKRHSTVESHYQFERLQKVGFRLIFKLIFLVKARLTENLVWWDDSQAVASWNNIPFSEHLGKMGSIIPEFQIQRIPHAKFLYSVTVVLFSSKSYKTSLLDMPLPFVFSFSFMRLQNLCHLTILYLKLWCI